jgi:hypothetical protein
MARGAQTWREIVGGPSGQRFATWKYKTGEAVGEAAVALAGARVGARLAQGRYSATTRLAAGGKTAAEGTARCWQAAKIDVGSIVSNPRALWGRSAGEIAEAFNEAGYDATVRQSTRGSGRAQIVEIEGHPQVSQIQVHPGGGRHGGSYVKISTSTQGILKVVDETTYRPAPGEKATIIKAAE